MPVSSGPPRAGEPRPSFRIGTDGRGSVGASEESGRELIQQRLTDIVRAAVEQHSGGVRLPNRNEDERDVARLKRENQALRNRLDDIEARMPKFNPGDFDGVDARGYGNRNAEISLVSVRDEADDVEDALPTGGNQYEVLYKNSSADGDWTVGPVRALPDP